ncbi:hypothetical protein [Tissierella sp.]|uniref:hypothetical protein n=1 Tax=Tissierella sp. TaxID=41274 RepID=UPI00304AC31E
MDSTTLTSALGAVDLSVIMDSILGILPIALPVVVGMIGLKKGIGFFKKMIKGA